MQAFADEMMMKSGTTVMQSETGQLRIRVKIAHTGDCPKFLWAKQSVAQNYRNVLVMIIFHYLNRMVLSPLHFLPKWIHVLFSLFVILCHSISENGPTATSYTRNGHRCQKWSISGVTMV